MTVSEAIRKMIERCDGNQYDINHFLKVWAYSKLIGELEGVSEDTLLTVQYAAIVHDIACPGLREQFDGRAPYEKQEMLGEPLAEAFYGDSIPAEMLERVKYLVAHHHTYTGNDGIDHQILFEADFLTNAGEKEKHQKRARDMAEHVFRTAAGMSLLKDIFAVEFE